jgi:hypothetical protein
MSQERLSDELAAIEAALCSLTPAASGIERERLMFLAGRASAKRTLPLECGDSSPLSVDRFNMSPHACRAESKAAMNRRTPKWLWPLATAVSFLAAISFAALWATSSHSQVSQSPGNPVFAVAPMALDVSGEASPSSPWENRHLCRLVLEKGVDALPESRGTAASGIRPLPREETYRGLLRQFLSDPTG